MLESDRGIEAYNPLADRLRYLILCLINGRVSGISPDKLFCDMSRYVRVEMFAGMLPLMLLLRRSSLVSAGNAAKSKELSVPCRPAPGRLSSATRPVASHIMLRQEHVHLVASHESRGDDGSSPPLASNNVDFHRRSEPASCSVPWDVDVQSNRRKKACRNLD